MSSLLPRCGRRSMNGSEIEGLKSKIAKLEKSYADVVKSNDSSGNGETKAQFEEPKRRIV